MPVSVCVSDAKSEHGTSLDKGPFRVQGLGFKL